MRMGISNVRYFDWKEITVWFCRVVMVAVFIAVIAMTFGCSTIRTGAIYLSEEEYRNYETSKEVAQTWLLYWEFQSGMIKQALGNKVPMDVAKMMDELDKWAKLPTVQQTDEILGRVLVARLKVLSDVMKLLYDIYAPGLFEILVNIGGKL